MSVSAAVAAGAAALARAGLARTTAFARRALFNNPPGGERGKSQDNRYNYN